MSKGSDQDWKRLGKLDPYYAVLTDEKFKQENLNSEVLQTYFDSGEQVVAEAAEMVKVHFGQVSKPERGLDFGCGTARLTIPLARYCQSVVGIDISEDMLEKARFHCQEAGVNNAEFVLGDDLLSNVVGSFDFLISYIVLQHIPIERGEAIFSQLLALLRVNGIGCIQIPYLREMSMYRRMGYQLRVHIPYVNQILNKLSGRPSSYPLMQFNVYNLNSILHLLHKANCNEVYIRVSEHSDPHSIYNNAFLYFKKEAST